MEGGLGHQGRRCARDRWRHAVVPAHEHDPYDANYANPARLHAAGVTVAICSQSGGPAAATAGRNLPYEAATAIAFGLPEDAGLRAVTITPRRDSRRCRQGGLTGGGRARPIVVTAGHILQPTTPVLALFIDGRHVTPDSRQTQLYDKYLTRLDEVREGTAPLGLERPAGSRRKFPAEQPPCRHPLLRELSAMRRSAGR